MNIIIEEVISEFPVLITEEVFQITISDAVSYFDIVEVADTSFVGKKGYIPVVNETTGKLVLSPQSGGGVGIPEAPIDGTTYGRKDGAWEAVGAGAIPTLQEVTDTGANTTNLISVYNIDDSEYIAVTSRSIDFINPDGLTGVSLKASTQTGNVGEVLIPDAGTTQKTIAFQEYVDAEISAAVAGLLDDRGNYDASSDTFPSSGGSGTAGAILKGDLWTISVAGTLGGVAVTVGDVIRAKVDAPGTTSSNWVITENNIGYVPENNANKSNDLADVASTVKFPVWAIISTYITNALASFKTANFLDATSSIQGQLNGKIGQAVMTNTSATSTVVGWSSFTNKLIFEYDFGNGFVLVEYFLNGASNSINASFTLTNNQTSFQRKETNVTYVNNGTSSNTNGMYRINKDSNVVSFFQTQLEGTFTASGNKSVRGVFIYYKG